MKRFVASLVLTLALQTAVSDPSPTATPAPTSTPAPSATAAPTPEVRPRGGKKSANNTDAGGKRAAIIASAVLGSICLLVCGGCYVIKKSKQKNTERKDSWDISTMFSGEERVPEGLGEEEADESQNEGEKKTNEKSSHVLRDVSCCAGKDGMTDKEYEMVRTGLVDRLKEGLNFNTIMSGFGGLSVTQYNRIKKGKDGKTKFTVPFTWALFLQLISFFLFLTVVIVSLSMLKAIKSGHMSAWFIRCSQYANYLSILAVLCLITSIFINASTMGFKRKCHGGIRQCPDWQGIVLILFFALVPIAYYIATLFSERFHVEDWRKFGRLKKYLEHNDKDKRDKKIRNAAEWEAAKTNFERYELLKSLKEELKFEADAIDVIQDEIKAKLETFKKKLVAAKAAKDQAADRTDPPSG